jgi:hypothetical protein
MNDDKLMQGSVALLIFAIVLIVLGQLLANTALGQVTPAESWGAWLSVILGAHVVAFGVTVAAVRLGKAVGRRQASSAQAQTPAAQPPRKAPGGKRVYNYEELQW